MSVLQFTTEFGYAREAVYVSKYLDKKGLAKYYIAETNLMDDKAFREDIANVVTARNIAHTLYYPAVELCHNISGVARILSSVTGRHVNTWTTWLSYNLFRVPIQVQTEIPVMFREFIYVTACLFVIASQRRLLDPLDWIY